MSNLTQGRKRQCKNNIGGFNTVYLFPFIKYSRSQIVLTENVVDTFPDSLIYPFEVVSGTYTESQSEDDGGKSYTSNLSFSLIGWEVNTELVRFLKKDYRAIVKDRNDNYRLLGTYNGLIADLTFDTGGGASDFSGYTLNFEGQEAQQDFFITDLEDAGFEIVENNFLLLEDGTYILTEDNQKIIVEV